MTAPNLAPSACEPLDEPLHEDGAVGVIAFARTQRRRLLFCAWTSRPPSAKPFVAPDFWEGGYATEAEAIADAEGRAGGHLRRIDPRWAGAFLRMRRGLPPFPSRGPRRAPAVKGASFDGDPFRALGLSPGADVDAIRAAFRSRALEVHPDVGGDAAEFIALKLAYDAAMARARRA